MSLGWYELKIFLVFLVAKLSNATLAFYKALHLTYAV